MKKKVLILSMLPFFLLCGCNGVGEKDRVIVRVGGESIYAEDFDFIVHSQGESGKLPQNIVDDFILNTAVESEALSLDPKLKLEWVEYQKYLENRALAYVYQRFYLNECLMQDEAVLKEYFNTHKASFGGDSVKFIDVRKKVAEKKFLESKADSVDMFVKFKLPLRNAAAKINLFYYEGDSLNAEQYATRFASAKERDDIPGAEFTQVLDFNIQSPFNDSAVVPYMFGEKEMQVGETKVVRLSNSKFLAMGVTYRRPLIIAKEEDHRESLEKEYLDSYLKKITVENITDLVEKYQVKIESINVPGAEDFYANHKSDFMTKPGFVLYHMASADSSKLAASSVSLTKDLDAFKKLASETSEKKETASKGGFIGKVLIDHVMPYGIGIVDGLYEELNGKAEGYVSSVLKSQSDSLYHVFYLEKSVPAEQKPFERVVAAVKSRLMQEDFALDSNYVLVTKAGKPIFYEKDVLKIYSQQPNIPRGSRSRMQLMRMYAESAAIAEEARKMKLDHTWEYRAMMRQARQKFIVDRFEQVLANKKNIPEDTLKALFEKIGNPMNAFASYEDSKLDLVNYIMFPKNILEYEYYFTPANNDGKSIEENKKRIYEKRGANINILRLQRQKKNAFVKSNISIYDTSITVDQSEESLDQMFARADSLHKENRIQSAVSVLNNIRGIYPENDTAFAKATLYIAQMLSEIESEYENAQAEYYVFYKMWPNSPDVEKAMFSRGFILTENLNRDAEALIVLEEFQKLFPKSELKESVDWLVENIKSGGKLADDLMKKISEE